MQITLGTTEALGNEKWKAIEPGLTYWRPGKIMIVQGEAQVLIIDLQEEKANMNRNELGNVCGLDLEQVLEEIL